MLKAIDEKGELRNVKTNEDGALKVFMEEGTYQDKIENTLICNILSVGTEATSIPVGKKITGIMIANYSETADVTINDGFTDYIVGAGVALELPINEQVENILVTAGAADTKIQLVVKGVN